MLDDFAGVCRHRPVAEVGRGCRALLGTTQEEETVIGRAV